MLTTTATILFLLVASALAALAVHEFLGSGRSRSTEDVASLDHIVDLQADVQEIDTIVDGLHVEQARLADDLERRHLSVTKEGAQHEAAIAAAFHEARNGNSELRGEFEHLKLIMAELGTRVAATSQAEVRMDRIERSLQSQDMRLCTLDESLSEVVQSLAPDNKDLKRIKGVGAALEQTLKGLGVETLEDVANLDVDKLESLSEKLGSFASRITRDRWIEQAQEMVS